MSLATMEEHAPPSGAGETPREGAWADRRARMLAEAREEEVRRQEAVLRRFRWSAPGVGKAPADIAATIDGVDSAGVLTTLRRLAELDKVHVRDGLWYVGPARPDPAAELAPAPERPPLTAVVLEVAGELGWVTPGELLARVEPRAKWASRTDIATAVARLRDAGDLQAEARGGRIRRPPAEPAPKPAPRPTLSGPALAARALDLVSDEWDREQAIAIELGVPLYRLDAVLKLHAEQVERRDGLVRRRGAADSQDAGAPAAVTPAADPGPSSSVGGSAPLVPGALGSAAPAALATPEDPGAAAGRELRAEDEPEVGRRSREGRLPAEAGGSSPPPSSAKPVAGSPPPVGANAEACGIASAPRTGAAPGPIATAGPDGDTSQDDRAEASPEANVDPPVLQERGPVADGAVNPVETRGLPSPAAPAGVTPSGERCSTTKRDELELNPRTESREDKGDAAPLQPSAGREPALPGRGGQVVEAAASRGSEASAERQDPPPAAPAGETPEPAPRVATGGRAPSTTGTAAMLAHNRAKGDVTRAHLLALVRAEPGASTATLAEGIGRTASRVGQLGAELGLVRVEEGGSAKWHPPGWDPAAAPPPPTPKPAPLARVAYGQRAEDVAAALARHPEGAPLHVIAADAGVDPESVRKALQRLATAGRARHNGRRGAAGRWAPVLSATGEGSLRLRLRSLVEAEGEIAQAEAAVRLGVASKDISRLWAPTTLERTPAAWVPGRTVKPDGRVVLHAEAETGATPPSGPSRPTRAALVDHVRLNEGCTCRDAAEALGISVRRVSKLVSEMPALRTERDLTQSGAPARLFLASTSPESSGFTESEDAPASVYVPAHPAVDTPAAKLTFTSSEPARGVSADEVDVPPAYRVASGVVRVDRAPTPIDLAFDLAQDVQRLTRELEASRERHEDTRKALREHADALRVLDLALEPAERELPPAARAGLVVGQLRALRGGM